MGSAICRSVNISTNSRRSDLKNSRFDSSAKKKDLNTSKRSQVQPIANKIATMNTSFLNHTKSNISKNHANSSKDTFLEELDCNYCKDTLLNGAIANKIANNQLNSGETTRVPNSPDSIPKPPLTPFVGNSTRSRSSQSPSDPSVQVEMYKPVPTIVHPNESVVESIIDNGSELDILYRSVSTIPLAPSDDEEEPEINEEMLVNKAKSGSLDEGIDLKLKRNCRIDNVSDGSLH